MLTVMMNFKKMDPQEVSRRIAEGRKHLNFMVSLYRKQLARGRHFLHEHPQTAASWAEVGIKSLSQSPYTHLVTADQCMFGRTTPTTDGDVAPAKKPTVFMTSSPQMAEILSRRCNGKHQHQQLVSGRCYKAAFYPLKLVQAII